MLGFLMQDASFFSDVGSGIAKAATIFFWFVVILIPLVIIHEFGHLLMAKLFKVRVVEYGVGIPPRTPWFFKKWGVVWSLNWLPFGGFAKIYGDHDALDAAQDTYKADPTKTTEKYVEERTAEILYGKELEYILTQNGIAYDARWQAFDRTWMRKNLSAEETAEHAKLLEQLKKLVQWELKAKLTSKEAFFNRGFFPKLVILLGGVIFNFLAAWIIIFLILNFASISRSGYEKAPDRIRNNYALVQDKLDFVVIADKVLQDGKEIPSALSKAGITPDDKLLSIDGKAIADFDGVSQFSQYLAERNGQPSQFSYIPKNETATKTVAVQPEKNANGKWVVGMIPVYKTEYKARDFISSFGATNSEIGFIGDQVWGGLKKVGAALLPQATDRSALQEVSGPIGVGGIGSLVYQQQGVVGILYLMALVSMGLAITNLLPIPALDGGRILIALVAALTGRRNKKVESILISATFLLLLGLIVLVAVKDIGFVKNL
jgi:regulator of sigma E protease